MKNWAGSQTLLSLVLGVGPKKIKPNPQTSPPKGVIKSGAKRCALFFALKAQGIPAQGKQSAALGHPTKRAAP